MAEEKKTFIETISKLPGVGAAKAEALWEAGYRTVDEVRAASADELAERVDGVGPKLAEAIIQGLADLETEAPEPEVEVVEEMGEEPVEEPDAEIVEAEAYLAKPKPELDDETERALAIREQVNAKRPRFVRRNWWQFPRFDKHTPWRAPRGTLSKQRRDKKHVPARVKIGYRGPRAARGLHPSGFEEVLVHNPDGLGELDPETQAARIASTVGRRKRVQIVEAARDLGIHILNPGGLQR